MMKKYTIVFTDTGRVHCLNECAENDLPPEGPLASDPSLTVVHGHMDIHIGMLVSGEKSRLPNEEIQAIEDADQWFRFRQRRSQILSETDFKMVPDYPLPQSERRALAAKRKALRDIPQKTTNPRLAMQILETILKD